jgi:hypothetical protein
MVDTDFAAEPGLLVSESHVRSAIGTDKQGRRHVMKEEQNKHRPDCMLFQDVPADVQEFVTLSGEVAGTVIADRQEYRLPLAKGSRLETPSGRLTILAVETLDSIRNKEKTRVTVAYRKNRNAAGVHPTTGEGLGGLDGDDFQLEMASGERTECSGSQTSWGDEWTVEHTLGNRLRGADGARMDRAHQDNPHRDSLRVQEREVAVSGKPASCDTAAVIGERRPMAPEQVPR